VPTQSRDKKAREKKAHDKKGKGKGKGKKKNRKSPFKTRSAKKSKGKWPVYVKESGRHGLGLFATRKIDADTLILPLVGKKAKKDGIYVLWSIDGSEGLEVTNEARYVNHASNPNAAYFEDGVWSLREIAKHEEITHHYGDAWNHIE